MEMPFVLANQGGAKIYRADGSVEVLKPFVYEDNSTQKTEILSKINDRLNMNNTQPDSPAVDPEEE